MLHCVGATELPLLMLLVLLSCSLLQFEGAVPPPKMQDHPKTADGASQKAKRCCPKQTLDDILLGSKHNTTKAKACAVVIQNGCEEPSTSPIQRIHLEGKQGIIRERPA